MAFKKSPPPISIPNSPEKLILDLPRRKIKGALLHQGEIMKSYAADAIEQPNVALQLPTGSGKTLVGLMIAEWRRRKLRERIIYLCPTRQLVHQVVEQANEEYGLTVHGFTGSRSSYDPTAKSEYQNADRIAVTTYSSLFNSNPFFEAPEIIIIDDAHAAENYIAKLWSLRITRTEHSILHTALSGLIKPLISSTTFARLTGEWEGTATGMWTDKLPTPEFYKIHENFISIVDIHVSQSDLKYSWGLLRDHLHACHLYLTSQEILLRPLIPPTWTHQAFHNAKQRIFMSATLGKGGDLERLTGCTDITRLPAPDGWDKQGIGRRYFIFPEMALNQEECHQLRRELMKEAGRSLVLVPNDRLKNEIKEDISEILKYPIFEANDIEISKKAFIDTPQSVAIVANRYDGIDFPGEDCRLLFIDGLPRAANAQELFLMSRMGCNLLFNERIHTRIIQAVGRCTRSLEDYSAVVVSGESLPDYLADRNRRKFFHPELQAELDFGIEQSQGASVEDLVENFQIFLENSQSWEEANEQILSKRESSEQFDFPAIQTLMNVVKHEIKFQRKLWQGDFEDALIEAESVIAKLIESELKGYRALWNYLAGSAAWLGSEKGKVYLKGKARNYFQIAKNNVVGISWLVDLARHQIDSDPVTEHDSVLFKQLENVESILSKLGTQHDRKFTEREKIILEGLNSSKSALFEQAHQMLGELLGFQSGKKEEEGSPDPWWIIENICFVFEDHNEAKETSSLDTTKARQAYSHPNWIRENVLIENNTKIISVLVTPVKKADVGAKPHLNDVMLWPLSEFILWAKDCLTIIRTLRSKFYEPGDLKWRSEAAEKFKSNRMDAKSLLEYLENKPARKLLKIPSSD